MKRILMIALLAMVSYALAGTPVEAAQTSSHPGTMLVKHGKKHHKTHKKHRKS